MILLDTHVLVWWVSGASALTRRAKQAIRQRLERGGVSVSAMSVFEVATAVRRGRLVLGPPFDQWIAAVRALPELSFVPMTDDIASAAGGFDDAFPGDPADRIIAATAIACGARLVTADARLRSVPKLETVW